MADCDDIEQVFQSNKGQGSNRLPEGCHHFINIKEQKKYAIPFMDLDENIKKRDVAVWILSKCFTYNDIVDMIHIPRSTVAYIISRVKAKIKGQD